MVLVLMTMLQRNVPLWLKQFPDQGTKATFSHDDLSYLKDSVISLWNDLGIKMVMANIVFEDVWKEGDDVIYENQLRKLADFILENEMWRDYSVRFFDPHIGFPLNEEELKSNYCGSGKMLAIDCDGNLYPCVRFFDFSLNNKKGYKIGDIFNGINQDRLRPFDALSLETQSSKECIECEIASGCSWCTGCNYDMADTDTIYQRAIFLCKMHKANVRANVYFWEKFSKVTGLESPRTKFAIESERKSNKYLQILISDNITPHCSYRNWNNSSNIMRKDVLQKGMDFAKINKMRLTFLGSPLQLDYCPENDFVITGYEQKYGCSSIIVYDNEVGNMANPSDNCILLINRSNVSKISVLIERIYQNTNRVNLILEEIETWEKSDLEIYESQLDLLIDIIVNSFLTEGPRELNVMSDITYIKNHVGCDAGEDSFTLAPNGKIYICPAFYFNDPEDNIGSLEAGINIKNAQLLELKNAPICKECDAFHCRRCKFLNKKLTGQINIPSKIQCIISHLERNKARRLQYRLKKEKGLDFINNISEIEYLDPLEKILSKKWGV